VVCYPSFSEKELPVTRNRRDFLATSSLALAGIGLARVPTLGQAPAQTPPVTKFEEIRRGVGMFTGNGGTIGYLVNADGAIAVDSQFVQTAEMCVSGLKQKAPKGIAMLINTHHHGDHTGGNPAFRGAVKTIVQQERCAKLHKETTEKAGTAAAQAYADVTFGESWSHDFGDEKVWARHNGPGHTGGDAVIVFEKANVVHGGDLLFRRLHPFIDRPAGASVENWIKILDRLASGHDSDTVFIFGHGKDGTVLGKKADVTYFRDYLSAALSHAKQGVQARQSREEVTKLQTLKGFDDVAAIGERLTLANVLGTAFDEVSAR
ncbi:MAG: MBL fold metallo-hydrolase, partial [Vicinamibacterales bacterium]